MDLGGVVRYRNARELLVYIVSISQYVANVKVLYAKAEIVYRKVGIRHMACGGDEG